jgi:hypothetical protein
MGRYIQSETEFEARNKGLAKRGLEIRAVDGQQEEVAPEGEEDEDDVGGGGPEAGGADAGTAGAPAFERDAALDPSKLVHVQNPNKGVKPVHGEARRGRELQEALEEQRQRLQDIQTGGSEEVRLEMDRLAQVRREREEARRKREELAKQKEDAKLAAAAKAAEEKKRGRRKA